MLYTVPNGDESALQTCSFWFVAQLKFIDYFVVICKFKSDSSTSAMGDGIVYASDLPRYVLAVYLTI